MQRSISWDSYAFLITEIVPNIILISFILGLIGFIGNVFTFLQPNLRWNNCCIYMLCSSIVDIIHLTINIFPSYLQKSDSAGLPWKLSFSLCKLNYFLYSFLPQLSINLLLLSIIDQYACTCALTSWIHRLNKLKMVPRLILMMVCISGIFSIYSPILGNDAPGLCGYHEETIYGILTPNNPGNSAQSNSNNSPQSNSNNSPQPSSNQQKNKLPFTPASQRNPPNIPKAQETKNISKIIGLIFGILIIIALIGGIGFYTIRKYHLNKSVSLSSNLEDDNNKGLSSLAPYGSQQSLSTVASNDMNSELSIHVPSKLEKSAFERQDNTAANKRTRATSSMAFTGDI
ncbi:unnamed protein product [Adineta steineri]|uniref:G-protein coupled receptors family 1 profile domain-containing protein n=1 Tax=Adineta steineri TaxID=433720 RepID=A0A813NST0_9BILA|nr:unnamed protein product [Adineta steineri]